MTERTSSKRDAQIRELAERILLLCKDVPAIPKKGTVDPERTAAEFQELSEKGICPNCEKPLKDSPGPVRRGLDTGCYNEVKRLVDTNVLTDEQAVAAGLWKAAEKGGRPKATEREGSAAQRYMRRLREMETQVGVAQAIAGNHSRRKKK